MGDELPQRDLEAEWLEQFWADQNAAQADKRFAGHGALQLARAALANGAAFNFRGEVEWDCAGDCVSPRELFHAEVAHDLLSHLRRENAARKAARALLSAVDGIDLSELKVNVKPRPIGVKVSLHVRCRECEHCLRARGRMWAWRAVSEWETSERTWLGTLTLRPTAHDHFRLLAQRRGDVRANDFDALGSDAQLQARNREIASELTLFLKRVRKNSGSQFRYLLVMEAHKSGLPHYHVLINQQPGQPPIAYDVLRHAWRAGFSKFNLVLDKRAAIYACKYLSKSALARVRASRDYGNPERLISVPVLPNPVRTHSKAPKGRESGPTNERPVFSPTSEVVERDDLCSDLRRP